MKDILLGTCKVEMVQEVRLFLVLEGAQAGLSWPTILRKREGYRKAFIPHINKL